MVQEKIASGTLPESVRCRMVLPGADEEGSKVQRSFTLWEGKSLEEIRTEVLALLGDHCETEFVEILDDHCIGLDKSEWVPLREKVNRRISQARASVKSFDETHKVSEKTAALAESTKVKAGRLYESTGETMKVMKEKSGPVMSSGVKTMKMGWSSMISKVQDLKAPKKESSGDTSGVLEVKDDNLVLGGGDEGGHGNAVLASGAGESPAIEEKSADAAAAPESTPATAVEQTPDVEVAPTTPTETSVYVTSTTPEDVNAAKVDETPPVDTPAGEQNEL